MSLQSVLCPTDFSDTASRAAQQAAILARRSGARLHLFHAVLPASGERIEKMLEAARQKLREASDALLETGDVEVTSSAVAADGAVEAVLGAIEDLRPDLVVMGTEGRAGVAGLFSGAVAEKVLRQAPGCVMTLAKGATLAEGPIERVLVLVDFTDLSRRALDAARSFASRASSLSVLHVIESPIRPSAGPPSPPDPEFLSQVEKDLEHWVDGEVGELEVMTAETDVASDVLRAIEAKEAQLVVMGTRGLTGLDRFLLGSLAEKIVREAPVPVLTVK